MYPFPRLVLIAEAVLRISTRYDRNVEELPSISTESFRLIINITKRNELYVDSHYSCMIIMSSGDLRYWRRFL